MSQESAKVGVLQDHSKQSSQYVKIRFSIDGILTNPEESRLEQPILRRFIQISDKPAEMMDAEYQSETRVKDLSVKYRISRETISKRLRLQSISPRKVGLDAHQIKDAARLYNLGDSLATIGKRMDVSTQTVQSRLIMTEVEMRSSYENPLSKPNSR